MKCIPNDGAIKGLDNLCGQMITTIAKNNKIKIQNVLNKEQLQVETDRLLGQVAVLKHRIYLMVLEDINNS